MHTPACVCAVRHAPEGQDTGGDAGNAATEYHCIYMVSKHEYDECRVDGLERRKPVLKCDRPHDSLKYTLKKLESLLYELQLAAPVQSTRMDTDAEPQAAPPAEAAEAE